MRTCVGCRTRARADELVRMRANEAGEVHVAAPGGSGRGAWVHRDEGCLLAALTRGGFARALRRQVHGDASALAERVGCRKEASHEIPVRSE
ncbi:MAG: YlxR family protein [Actinomycetaceae bacterium]|nr:YlxR family protein [Actinomycetaceae bacterium]